MASVTITRVAHSTVLIDFGGRRILTDPWFSEKWGYYHGEPYGIELRDLPPLDAVIVSHGHYDHYDMESFAAYPDKAVPMFVKRGIAEKARQVGFTHVVEMDAGEVNTVGDLRITAGPAKHAVPEITYVLECGGLTVFFGADTMLIPELDDIAHAFPRIDVALLAVNGLIIRPMLNRHVVMSARQAAQLCGLLKPRYAIPTHYAFTGGPLQDHVLLKYDGTAEEFAAAVPTYAPQTIARVLPPGVPLTVEELATAAPATATGEAPQRA